MHPYVFVVLHGGLVSQWPNWELNGLWQNMCKICFFSSWSVWQSIGEPSHVCPPSSLPQSLCWRPSPRSLGGRILPPFSCRWHFSSRQLLFSSSSSSSSWSLQSFPIFRKRCTNLAAAAGRTLPHHSGTTWTYVSRNGAVHQVLDLNEQLLINQQIPN